MVNVWNETIVKMREMKVTMKEEIYKCIYKWYVMVTNRKEVTKWQTTSTN